MTLKINLMREAELERQKEFKKECFMNLINSLLAGALVFTGSFADGNISREGIIISVGTSLVVAISKFKDFWKDEMKRNERCERERKKMFSFI